MTDHNGVKVECKNCKKYKCFYRDRIVKGDKYDVCRSNFEATTKALEDRIRKLENALDEMEQKCKTSK